MYGIFQMGPVIRDLSMTVSHRVLTLIPLS